MMMDGKSACVKRRLPPIDVTRAALLLHRCKPVIFAMVHDVALVNNGHEPVILIMDGFIVSVRLPVSVTSAGNALVIDVRFAPPDMVSAPLMDCNNGNDSASSVASHPLLVSTRPVTVPLMVVSDGKRNDDTCVPSMVIPLPMVTNNDNETLVTY